MSYSIRFVCQMVFPKSNDSIGPCATRSSMALKLTNMSNGAQEIVLLRLVCQFRVISNGCLV